MDEGTGSAFPSASPPGVPGSRFGSGGSSSFDRMHEQMERSRQERLDSMQRMEDRMAAQREQLFNRHGSTGECLSCKHTLTDAEMRRSSCPHCGVTWDHEIDEFGNKRNLNNSSLTTPFAGGGNAGGSGLDIDRNTARTIGIVFGALIGLAVVLGMIIGTIYILMSIASASSTSQRQHYR
jgi:hypothetical protein